jgi:tetratricopeptide (TPR) repeat protein
MPDAEKQLSKAKATLDVIAAIKAAGPKERQATARASAIASGLPVVAPEESADFKALETELDPDKSIAMAEAFAQKYPKSEVLSYVLVFEANAYENKGDAVKTVELAEKSLALKPDNFMALLMVCYAMPQPQYIKHHDADEGKQLEKAEAYCKQAQAAIESVKKLESESEADFADRKAGYASSIHADRGMIHLDLAQMGLMSIDTDEVVKAVKEYNAAVSYSRPQPTDYFRLGEANELLGKKDDAIAAYTQASQLGHGVLKQYADRKIATLKAAK